MESIDASDTRLRPTFSSAVLLLLSILLPFLYTRYTSRNVARPSKDGGPPIVPYLIPWLGSAISFVRDFDKFEEYVRKTIPAELPCTILLGGQYVYYVHSPGLYAKAVRKTRTLGFDPVEAQIFEKILPLSEQDKAIFTLGMQGFPVPPGLTQSDVDKKSMRKALWIQYHENLAGESSKLILKIFTEDFKSNLGENFTSTDWQRVSIYPFLQQSMFRAATRSLFGSHFSSLAPHSNEDFWAFDDGFLDFWKGYPPWLLRKPVAARTRLLQELKNWEAVASAQSAHLDHSVLWDEWFGSRLMRERVKVAVDAGLSADGRAAHHLGLFWANTVASATWALINISQDADLMDRLRQELSEAVQIENVVPGAAIYENNVALDVETLVKLPLLKSVFQESLRLCVSSTTTREVMEDTELEGFKLKKGHMLLMPSRALQTSPDAWETGEHSADEFWAERFVETDIDTKEMRQARSLSWRPFGAGASYCVGRHVAAAEVMTIVALFLTCFEVELDHGVKPPCIDRSKLGIGAMRPEGEVFLRLRRARA